MGVYPQDEVLQTPVTAEALTSLHSLIEQDTHALNERSKQRLQKFANAAQIPFTERALLADKNRLLIKQNNEAKVRRSTKSTIIGKTKVMSYKNIENARAKRAAKEDTTAGKGTRGRKRKSLTPMTGNVKRARRSEAEVAKDEIAAAGMENHCSVLQL